MSPWHLQNTSARRGLADTALDWWEEFSHQLFDADWSTCATRARVRLVMTLVFGPHSRLRLRSNLLDSDSRAGRLMELLLGLIWCRGWPGDLGHGCHSESPHLLSRCAGHAATHLHHIAAIVSVVKACDWFLGVDRGPGISGMVIRAMSTHNGRFPAVLTRYP